MEIALTLMSKLMSMMLMVVVGYAAVKCGIMKQEDSRPLSALCVYILVPCMIVHAFQIDLTPERVRGFCCCVVFSFVVYILWILLARLLRRPFRLDPVDESTLVYSNVGNLILPLVNMVLGPDMVFYGSSLQLPFCLFIWTHCYSTIRGERGFHLGRLLRNPNIIAVGIGLVTLIFRIRFPEVIATTISGFSAMVGPTSMLMIGLVIAGADLKSVVTYKKAYGILFGRLVVFPAIAIGVLYLSGFLARHPEYTPVLLIVIMAFSAPPASTISQIAVLYNVEPMESSIYNVLGNILCIFTMPLAILCYQLLFHA